ncbi:Soluble Scavenger Receptor Cysteine-Rich Domain-Containing Protein Ssc5D [Manis pentadactyla]|nr:Soluble Scavenger Receptor Cysteine-Rich Domain-Containing Protein Ssc5D [Manis pentadactyla]
MTVDLLRQEGCPSFPPKATPHGHAPDDALRLLRGDSRGRGHYPACPAARWRSESIGQQQKTQTSLSTVPIAASAPVSAEDSGAPGIGRHHSTWKEEEVATCPSPTPERELLARGSGGAVGCGEPRANSWTAEQRELPTNRRYVP